ncbi:pentapeptide repeat-containing protein [Glycomyces paridis]|uniref:Pentapeptide repeat-containing protein n=1 Tax=Glycomyces paridis TaxID=2126555 RepID=A0A4S8PFL7_9ACTN|nr:pentapeptide repeat-containing protein [Glycomyces paridis]THV27129.1 pentapeptide repeat-containing protein [Glycomyces paridis]
MPPSQRLAQWRDLLRQRGNALPPQRARGPRPIRTRVLWLTLGIAALGAWLYFDVQSDLIDQVGTATSLELTQLRLDTVRNTLTVAAAIGGAAALLLSFRRQQYDEYHSTEQRITELRIQAVQQLGSDNPTVRIGGLHNLERLGDQHPELRQVILDEICSFLRLPYTPETPREADATTESDPSAGGVREPGRKVDAQREVRLIAQEILQRRLRKRSDRDDRPVWSHERINLKNAVLHDLSLNGCALNNADFTNATFKGDTDFNDVTFADDADFEGVMFNGAAYFKRATFTSDSHFRDARFTRTAYFMGAAIKGAADFMGAAFNGAADFKNAAFHGDLFFRDATFTRAAYFVNATFTRAALFVYATFTGDADFRNATFTGEASFRSAAFTTGASYEGATFNRTASYGGANFNRAANFKSTTFNMGGNLRAATYSHVNLKGSRVRSGARISLPDGWSPGPLDYGYRSIVPSSPTDSGEEAPSDVPEGEAVP